MYFKVCVLLLFGVFVIHVTKASPSRTRRSPQSYLMPGIKNFLMTKTTDFIAQNETRDPMSVFESLNQIKSYANSNSKRQGKSKSSDYKLFNDTIGEFDYTSEKLLASGKISNKSQKKIRNKIKDLRNLAFNLSEKFLKSCAKSYNRHILYSTEHTLQVISSRRNQEMKEFEKVAHKCFKTLDMGRNFTANAEVSMAACYDNTLATISAIILSAHGTIMAANETTVLAIDLLRNCSEKTGDEIAFCIEDEGIKLNSQIVSIGSKVLLKSAEGADAILEQGIAYTNCLKDVDSKLQDYIIRNEINVRDNCKWGAK